jgi:hypothetical protein
MSERDNFNSPDGLKVNWNCTTNDISIEIWQWFSLPPGEN